ncbi:MAG: NAD(P)-dependent alcohol dehydrogenase [Flavobacteriia bacterium]|nr:NAD(P)-dependent alcohol dehydrogenase [Flavobacteriia bacterium]
MRAMINKKYSDSPNLEMRSDFPQPSLEPGKVLVSVRSVSLNAADLIMMSGKPYPIRFMSGLFKPKNQVLGADIAGVVHSVAPDVNHLKPGDAVFGDLSSDGFGGMAEFVSVPANRLQTLPGGLSFEEAASLPMAGVTALKALRDKANVQPGQRVLIVGASGGVGTMALQIAAAMGAEVWAVCSTAKVEQVRNLGAVGTIDYKKEDFTESAYAFDAIIDLAAKEPWKKVKRALKPEGVYVPVAFSLSATLSTSFGGDKKRIKPLLSNPDVADLKVLSDYVENLQLKPVIHQTFPFEKANEAIQLLKDGRAFGKVVLSL